MSPDHSGENVRRVPSRPSIESESTTMVCSEIYRSIGRIVSYRCAVLHMVLRSSELRLGEVIECRSLTPVPHNTVPPRRDIYSSLLPSLSRASVGSRDSVSRVSKDGRRSVRVRVVFEDDAETGQDCIGPGSRRAKGRARPGRSLDPLPLSTRRHYGWSAWAAPK